MQSTKFAQALAGPLLVVLLLSVGWLTRDSWTGWLIPAKDDKKDEAKQAAPDSPERVKLSAQAQKNLRLVVKEIRPTHHWRKIYLPGTVVDRPGRSDHGICAPISGVITHVFAIPGKTFRAGDKLFQVKIASESFQASQMDLYKYTKEKEIAQKELTLLERLADTGAVTNTRLRELKYQQERFEAMIQAHRQDLFTRQLTKEQVDGIETGVFVTDVVIRMPERGGKLPPMGSAKAAESTGPPVEYDVHELKVHLGHYVQAGQLLAYLSDHRRLYIEGKALKQEAQLLTTAAREGWPVDAEFTEDEDDVPGERLTNLSVEFLGAAMDPSGLTLPVYIPFDNPHIEYVRKDRTYHATQFRPGQKVLLKVSVAKIDNVFVLPVAAVVHEGAETYVFRQNGNLFVRKAVHVLLEDSEVAVIAVDGSIWPGNSIAHNAAAALNRILKASQSEGGGHDHHHH